MSNHSESAIARATAGDPDALLELLTQYGPGLAAHLRSGFPERHRRVIEIDDLLQDIAAEAMLSIRNARSGNSPTTSVWQSSFIGWTDGR